jgi:pSer/pThr/pTyr-binding forkhead associated (FHA) protein
LTNAGAKGSGSTVRCQRCGRENPPGLRFCQDCGQRLSHAPPPAAATPARGLAELAEYASRNAPSSQALSPQASPEAAPAGTAACSDCGTPNPIGARFCVACGKPVVTAMLPAIQPAAQAPPRAAAPRTPPAPRPEEGGYGPPRAAQQPNPGAVAYCWRCRGANTGQPFCQFCGARLDSPEQAGAQGREVPAAGRLVVIAQDGTPGRDYALAHEQTDIGREEGTILLPSDPYVSPRHARILLREGRTFVRDLSSVNGVYVRIRAAERLQHADLVLMGLEVLRFEVVSDAEKGLGPATENGTRVFGSPALPRYARLSQRTVEGVTRDVFYLCRDESVIGRESGDVVFTNDPFMSRRHAVFARDPVSNAFWLHDLGSSNGTYLAIRGERELIHGDYLRIGQHLFRLDVEMGGARS